LRSTFFETIAHSHAQYANTPKHGKGDKSKKYLKTDFLSLYLKIIGHFGIVFDVFRRETGFLAIGIDFDNYRSNNRQQQNSGI
jgi:hypothetical protein